MTELIVTVALWVAKFIFEKVEDKKVVGKLIAEWMLVMRKQFLSSAEVYKYYEEMNALADKEPWTET